MSLLDWFQGDTKPIGRDNVRAITVMNAKGGCGKTTIATNLAAHYADRDKAVTLADFDRQRSSLAWLAARPEDRPPINALNAWEDSWRVPRDTEIVVMDTAAATHDRRLARLLHLTQSVIIPVLPSPMDMRAAQDYIAELLDIHKHANLPAKLAIVANRTREYTRAYDGLVEFLEGLKLPFITSLRDSQNYVQAAERGLGIFEMAPSQVEADLETWEPLLKWLHSKRSRPKTE